MITNLPLIINNSQYFCPQCKVGNNDFNVFFGSLKLEIKRRSSSQNKIPDVMIWWQNWWCGDKIDIMDQSKTQHTEHKTRYTTSLKASIVALSKASNSIFGLSYSWKRCLLYCEKDWVCSCTRKRSGVAVGLWSEERVRKFYSQEELGEWSRSSLTEPL